MTEVTRSMRAGGPGEVARVARERSAAPSGLWGAVLLVATEVALFGSVLASYWYLSFQAPAWPPPGIERPEVVLPLVLTAVLVATSLPMALAVVAARRGRTGWTWLWIASATVVQCGYLAVQIYLFAGELERFLPQEHAYASVYYTILGLHHAHVLLGILLCLWVLARLVSGLTNYRLIGVRVTALYWHFVNVVGVLVALTQVSPSL